MSYFITALSLPVIALPTALLLKWRSDLPPGRRPDLKRLTWTYALSGTIGVIVVSTVQSIIAYVLGLILFGASFEEYVDEFGRTDVTTISSEQRLKRARMVKTWQYFAMLIVFTFVLAGLLEEIMKYFAIVANRSQQRKLKALDYISFAIASSLGFSMVENLGFVYVSTGTQSARMVVLTLVERLVIGTSAHCLMAVLTACNVIADDVHGGQLTLWQILYPAVLYHGFFDFAIFGVSALDGNVGWIHPTKPSSVLFLLGLVSSMLTALILHVRGRLARVSWTQMANSN